MIFPYREGLQFELELIAHGGRQEAFRETFKRPPLNTHQILQPEAYLKNEKPPQVTIGDLASVFGSAYQAYDSGSVGELDVQIMSEEFGRENDIYTVARKWDGGAYVAVKRAAPAADAKPETADLALVYLSRWKTQQAAERFGHIYLQGIAKRLPMSIPDQQRCDEAKCAGPLWEEHATTSEGPVHAELWPGNLLLITQSVDDAQMPALRSILLAGTKPLRSSATRSGAAPSRTTQPTPSRPARPSPSSLHASSPCRSSRRSPSRQASRSAWQSKHASRTRRWSHKPVFEGARLCFKAHDFVLKGHDFSRAARKAHFTRL